MYKNNLLSSSLFISIEGGEGSGKTLLASKMEEFFLNKGKKVIRTREPGGTSLGEYLRPLLLDPEKFLENSDGLSLISELFLFLSLRAQHLKEIIIPYLKQGYYVICERYHDSTIVYQGYALELGMDYVSKACRLCTPYIEPFKTFLLDIDPKIGLQRKRKQKNLDKFEKKEFLFHQKVREGFLLIAESFPDRICVEDASLSINELWLSIEAKLNKYNI